MEREKIKEIAEKYPEEIRVIPRAAFIEQLTDFLYKIQDKIK